MSPGKSIWLGYNRLSGRFTLPFDDVRGGVAVLGDGSNQLARLFALACHEAGLKPLVLDLDGAASESLSGYMDQYELPHFFYDTLRVDESANTHAQLASSAYASALELSFEQEAALNSICQIIANERGVVSPSSLADLIQSPESVKGRTVDRLRVRLETLRQLNMVGETGVVKGLLERGAILSFRGAGTPEAAEVAAALFIAKLLALGEEAGGVSPDVVILTEANRLFKSRPIFRKSQRFLTSFVSAPVPKVLASEEAYGLDEDYMDTCSLRILSSAAWNQAGKGLVLTPNMFMFQNPPYGYSEVFVPRCFEPRKGAPKDPAPNVAADARPEGRILEEIDGYDGATRASVLAFLSAEFPRDLLEKTFDRLQVDGCISAVPRGAGSRSIRTLFLTAKGKAMVEATRR